MTTETIPLTQDQGGARPDGPGAICCANGADTVSAHSGDAPSRDLTLPLNGVYFDQIASGEKLEEYRMANQFWTKRIVDRSYRNVILTRGYPKSGGVEGVTRLTRPWRGYVERVLTHPHFGDKPVRVFAIAVAK